MSATGRTLSLSLHGGIEALVAPALMAAPFLLDLSLLAAVVSFSVGAVLFGSALALVIEERPMSLSAHAGFDYVLAYFAMVTGIVVGITGDIPGMVLLVGVGAAMALLTASTRFSRARGA